MRNLQAAWEAIEKGDSVEAQSIVAQILRDDPKNAEAWMVLGEAVSGDRRELFLRKAIQLDPNLEIAKTKLAQLEAEADLDTKIAEVDELKVPPGVSLDAPTVPIEERLSGDRSTPRKANRAGANPTNTQKSTVLNNITLAIIALGILLAVYFFIQSLPV